MELQTTPGFKSTTIYKERLQAISEVVNKNALLTCSLKMKILTIVATIHHAESNCKEVKLMTLYDDSPQYTLTMLYCPELGKRVFFDRSDNTILLRD